MNVLTVQNLNWSYDDKTLFDNINLTIHDGARIGLVGPNGCGKSTLAKLMTGTLSFDDNTADSGPSAVKSIADIRIGHLEQVSEQTINGQVSQHKLSLLGVQNYKCIDEERLDNLSGGERTKHLLLEVLDWHYDLLILDEPTNHLDASGIEWLIDTLAGYPGAVIIISHNRYFLDQTVTSIAEIHGHRLNLYEGNYTAYELQKDHERYTQEQAYNNQQREKARIEGEISNLKQWSAKGHRDSTKKVHVTGTAFGTKEHFRKKVKKKDKQIKSKIKRLEKMIDEGVEKPEDLPEIRFNFEQGGHKAKKVLSVEHVSKYFGNRCLFRDVHFYIERGEKVALTGDNGTGKSTLINMIRGIDNACDGDIRLSSGVNVAYISQDILDLDRGKTMIETLDLYTKHRIQHGRHLLAGLGLGANMLHQKVGTLSMGERTRVKLAKVILDGVDVLILDEPTNHLDLDTKRTLEKALSLYQGTLLLCSHDRYLTDKVCNRTLRIIDGTIEDSSKKDIKKTPTNSDDVLVEMRKTQILYELSKTEPDNPDYERLNEEFIALSRK